MKSLCVMDVLGWLWRFTGRSREIWMLIAFEVVIVLVRV